MFALKRFALSTLCVTTTLASLPINARAEQGVSEHEIHVGVSVPLSGPASGLGLGTQRGFGTYFNNVNARGGVLGRKIVANVKDDGYEPERTNANTHALIEKEDSFVLFDFIGTPTSKAAVPLARRFSVPYLFPFTGAEFLRNPTDPYIFNLRASYFNETETLIEHFTKDLGLTKIGIFAQNDAYGDAGLSGVVRALSKRKLKIVGEGRYKRNTVEIGEGLALVEKAAPEAVILVGAYQACAEFIKRAKAGPLAKTRFANISFVGTEDLIKAMGPAGEGTYVSQIMPSPTRSELPIVKEYRKAMAASQIKVLEYASLEGYVNAAFLTDLLEKTGKDLTREKFLKTIGDYSADLGGLKASFSAKSHQAFDQVYLTQVKSGEAVEIEKMQ